MSNRTRANPARAEALGADLVTLVARFNRFATQQAPLDLPYAQVRLLALVDERGPSRISELAAYDSCSQPTMTGQVQRLEAADLVSRVDDPTDARAVLVSITNTGRRLLTTARAARAAAVAPHFAALDDDELDTLAAAVPVLRRLLAVASTRTDCKEPPS